MSLYASQLREQIKKGIGAMDFQHPLAGFRLVVDAGNGAGGFYANQVLAPLGADISGSQLLDPDGGFPNHIPNPENPQAMASAAIALEDAPGGTVVTDSITSDGLHNYIETVLRGRHHRFQRGYKNVINEALRLNAQGVNCPLAIETSGHAALRENHFLDDGAYLVTKIIIKMAALRREGKELEELLQDLKEPVESKEIRVPILEPDFRARGQAVIEQLEAYARENAWQIAPDNYEGIRVSFPRGQGDGWFLVRLSVHDPILPINIESDTAGGTALILDQLKAFLALHSQGLDLQVLGLRQ